MCIGVIHKLCLCSWIQTNSIFPQVQYCRACSSCGGEPWSLRLTEGGDLADLADPCCCLAVEDQPMTASLTKATSCSKLIGSHVAVLATRNKVQLSNALVLFSFHYFSSLFWNLFALDFWRNWIFDLLWTTLQRLLQQVLSPAHSTQVQPLSPILSHGWLIYTSAFRKATTLYYHRAQVRHINSPLPDLLEEYPTVTSHGHCAGQRKTVCCLWASLLTTFCPCNL